MRLSPWPATRYQNMPVSAPPTSEWIEVPHIVRESEVFKTSDGDSNDTTSTGSISSEDVDEANIKVASPGGVMKQRCMRRLSDGGLVHACCCQQDGEDNERDGEEQEVFNRERGGAMWREQA